MQTSRAYPEPRAALSLWATPGPMSPPPAAVVAAVVMFGDIHEAGGDGTTKIRFSRERLGREDMGLLLGRDAARASDVSVIWNERHARIVRVLDSAPLDTQALDEVALNRWYLHPGRMGPAAMARPPSHTAVSG